MGDRRRCIARGDTQELTGKPTRGRTAKRCTLANLLIAIPLLVTALGARPSSLRSRFAHDRNALLVPTTRRARLVTEVDLAPLPPVMQTYLRRVGAVGRPRVRILRVTFKAQMRSSATSPWMQSSFGYPKYSPADMQRQGPPGRTTNGAPR